MFSQAEASLEFQAPSAPAAVLYDMTSALTIEGEVRSTTSDDQVLVGLDTSTVFVEASVTSGHPLDDNLFLSEVLESGVHDLYASGVIPAGPQTQQNQPLGVFNADVSVEIENDVGPEAAPLRSLRVVPLPANRVNFLVPIDLRFSSITPTDPNAEFESAIALRCLVQVPADVVRVLDVSPASVSIEINPDEATVVLVEVYDGNATAARPDVDAVIDAVLDEIAAETAQRLGSEVQPIDALTLDEINTEVATLVQNRLVGSDEVLPFWQRAQDDDFTDATPVALDSSLVIAVNSGPEQKPAMSSRSFRQVKTSRCSSTTSRSSRHSTSGSIHPIRSRALSVLAGLPEVTRRARNWMWMALATCQGFSLERECASPRWEPSFLRRMSRSRTVPQR